MLSLLLIVVPGLIACSTGTGEAMLEDTAWVLESYGEPGNLKAVIADTEITAEFVRAEETVKGSAGCNSYFGSYELKGSQLSIPGPIGVTEMYCMEPKGVMDQEQEYLAVLQLAESYEIDSDELQIDCGSQVLIFKND
jgi:heat shock protein HslJ